MARAGIYVNGKEIVARYVGNKLVWKKDKWVEVGHFDRFNDWERQGDYILVRGFAVPKIRRGEQQQPDFEYNATRAVVNGKQYDITRAVMQVQDFYTDWHFAFLSILKIEVTVMKYLICINQIFIYTERGRVVYVHNNSK